jgi:hypothetical protein
MFVSQLQVFSIATSKLADFTLYGIRWTKNNFEYAAGKWDQALPILPLLHLHSLVDRLLNLFACSRILYSSNVHADLCLSLNFLHRLLDRPQIAPCSHHIGRQFLDGLNLPGTFPFLSSMFFQYGNVAKSLPKVGYIKAIDVYMVMTTG